MKGYTLIEILVGLTIISLLFGIGSVNFRDFSRREALNGVAKQIQGDLRLAQSAASSGQKPASCLTNLDGYIFKIYPTTEYKIEAKCGNNFYVNKDVFLPSGLSVTLSPNPILFKVLGQGTDIPAVSEATITITQQGTNAQKVIQITSGGEIK